MVKDGYVSSWSVTIDRIGLGRRPKKNFGLGRLKYILHWGCGLGWRLKKNLNCEIINENQPQSTDSMISNTINALIAAFDGSTSQIVHWFIANKPSRNRILISDWDIDAVGLGNTWFWGDFWIERTRQIRAFWIGKAEVQKYPNSGRHMAILVNAMTFFSILWRDWKITH